MNDKSSTQAVREIFVECGGINRSIGEMDRATTRLIQSETPYSHGVKAGDEILLWCAVINQVIADATEHFSTIIYKSHRKIIRDEARQWLLRGGKDYHLVCDMAGINPATLRERMTKIALAGWVIPEFHAMRTGPKVAASERHAT